MPAISEEYSAARGWIYSAVIWLAVATTFALIAAIEMVSPDFLGGISLPGVWPLAPDSRQQRDLFLALDGEYRLRFIISCQNCVAARSGANIWAEVAMWLWNIVGILMVS